MEEKRVEPRMLCADIVEIHWIDDDGQERVGAANLEDISTSGACLQTDFPIAQGTSIRMVHPEGEFFGVTCYCVFREIGFFLGVQFERDQRWCPQIFQPKHLLDLRELLAQTEASAPQPAGKSAL